MQYTQDIWNNMDIFLVLAYVTSKFWKLCKYHLTIEYNLSKDYNIFFVNLQI